MRALPLAPAWHGMACRVVIACGARAHVRSVVVIVLICIVAASLLAPLETVGEEAKLGFDVLVQFHEDTVCLRNHAPPCAPHGGAHVWRL